MGKYDPFRSRHKFQDDIWGQIKLSDLERDVIDTPEFQRLFRTSQLGFVDLVYHTANHTRGAHSIGVCHIADRLIDRLIENTSDLYQAYGASHPGLYASFDISPMERVLIRLGALLHDISHLPLSHDLEKKSHKILYHEKKELKLRSWYGHYDKHDDYDCNPLLYCLLCDARMSVLARVLRYYSTRFYTDLQRDAGIKTDDGELRHRHILRFVELVRRSESEKRRAQAEAWHPEKNLLPQLLFHLLAYEKPKEATSPVIEIMTGFDGIKERWHLGPKWLSDVDAKDWHDSWYQPFRHDIIGNTLSADLIDYLTRDPRRLGMQRQVDLHLLSYYALVNYPKADAQPRRYRCAIDLQDHKRGTTRTFLLNDLFRLLDLRQDIHEKAVMHRVVQSANAMLARGLLLLGEGKRPHAKDVVGLGEGQQHALQGEDLFFDQLLRVCDNQENVPAPMARQLRAARRIFEKLIERRVYRPLVIIPGNWAVEKLYLPEARGRHQHAEDFPLRTLAAIVDSAYYSPFLLFVCSCVEKYLQGVFDRDEDLYRYVNTIIAEDSETDLVRKASQLVPRRVIAWTTPYKQLYKDPAVVVAVEGWVGQIDDVVDPSFRPEIRDESTSKRIETAIRDADSKYATLWQLYVFVSDGLFYSGILNKLLKNLPASCTPRHARDEHEKRLRNAQAFLSVAFKAVCSNWPGLDQRHEEVEVKRNLLENCMDTKAFQELLISWVALYKCKTAWPEKWSTVEVEHYYHEYALGEGIPDELKRPCRDSRYKFAEDAQEAWRDSVENPQSDGYELIQFLKACHLDNLSLFSEAEFEQLVQLYADKETREMANASLGVSAPDHDRIPNALKALWLTGFPWPEHDNKQASEPELPNNPRDVDEWLLREAQILHPNVRRQLTEDLLPVRKELMDASAMYGRVVFDDFLLRLQRESTLMWNDIRTGRLATYLRRKWNHSNIAETPEADEQE